MRGEFGLSAEVPVRLLRRPERRPELRVFLLECLQRRLVDTTGGGRLEPRAQRDDRFVRLAKLLLEAHRLLAALLHRRVEAIEPPIAWRDRRDRTRALERDLECFPRMTLLGGSVREQQDLCARTIERTS